MLFHELRVLMPPAHTQNTPEERAHMEAEWPAAPDRQRPKLGQDAHYGQAFSGKGFAAKSMQSAHHSLVFLLDDFLSLFIQVGLS